MPRIAREAVGSLHFLRIAAIVAELRNIRPGNKGAVTSPFEHYYADVIVLLKIVQDLATGDPHILGHGIEPLGMIENHPSDNPVFFC